MPPLTHADAGAPFSAPRMALRMLLASPERATVVANDRRSTAAADPPARGLVRSAFSEHPDHRWCPHPPLPTQMAGQ
ncbi:hypothetical protein HYPSUDRAFT_207696 [Hypholoma sublateritium FD-334 SS-4]|uniref:Uncharacterized protein n=1 Tax=Hypholoma sublateritium (strain FD-334 SS-4) TaxID=945553 RepID=A0A0D2N919_HYPSF|nr:hypothetical protein HYPSUDRAFT_207696 [Hypholoma sublateritium FD-334 SS-4]